MSTNDVPGANPANADVLAMGCWAEHKDGSLILVESTETGRVIYSIFDVARDPPVEYRGALSETQFKRQFSWSPDRSNDDLWTWHDKTPFPWDRLIKEGSEEGERFVSAADLKTAAARVAESLRLRGEKIKDYAHMASSIRRPFHTVIDKLSRAIGELRK